MFQFLVFLDLFNEFLKGDWEIFGRGAFVAVHRHDEGSSVDLNFLQGVLGDKNRHAVHDLRNALFDFFWGVCRVVLEDGGEAVDDDSGAVERFVDGDVGEEEVNDDFEHLFLFQDVVGEGGVVVEAHAEGLEGCAFDCALLVWHVQSSGDVVDGLGHEGVDLSYEVLEHDVKESEADYDVEVGRGRVGDLSDSVE